MKKNKKKRRTLQDALDTGFNNGVEKLLDWKSRSYTLDDIRSALFDYTMHMRVKMNDDEKVDIDDFLENFFKKRYGENLSNN